MIWLAKVRWFEAFRAVLAQGKTPWDNRAQENHMRVVTASVPELGNVLEPPLERLS